MLTEIAPGPSDGSLESLLPADVPTRPRAIAVLDGTLNGRVWVDDPGEPRTVLVIETADGTVYAGGAVTREQVAGALAGVETRAGDLIFGFRGSEDPLRDAVPVAPYWKGQAIDFTDRRPDGDEADVIDPALPDGIRVVPIDATVLPRTEWYEDTLHAFGSLDRWESLGAGWAVAAGEELLAECTAGPRTRGLLEMGVVTREAHRRRGYGTLVSRLVARACEARGDRVWWNANAGNQPSLAIARRIGFRQERTYDLVACHTFGRAGSEA
jgi:RimJ/RimL family protein N-acetyltransferase